MTREKRIVMLGTSTDAWGGIASVVHSYSRSGLFERLPILYLATHCNGPALQKCRLFVCAWLAFVAMLARGQVMLVHVHTASDLSFWRKSCFLLPAFLFRVPAVLHIHAGPFPDFYRERCGRLAKCAVRQVLARVETVVVVSAELKRFVETLAAVDVIVVYNPMPLPAPVEFGARAPAQVLFLGKLGQAKGTWDLLHAVAQIVRRHPHLRLILAGDGELMRAQELMRRLGIEDQVELLGWVGERARTQLLERASVCVLPSYAEGLPMSVLEAMAAGVPVVATRVGGIPEVITDGVEGLLVAPGDVPALAAALDRLLADEAARRRMGLAARFRAETSFSSALVIPLLETMYCRAAGPALRH
ncbi:glycosyltransferase family 4 protein [Massilia horti]|uniref:Glycosyltransferase family 1 protein n=1 Tax=Massilia horti TaxID=2562153 RepID=A0A4Y9T314_9BURK|nr:glycosyltransferase family 4 protein [Massilia horti]TFW34376.1 glycosyltransferase family 1 protein [Massilia horti]